ncbi:MULTISPECIES: carbohydrate kinase family protein [unclassified Thermosipho (in: thermotogales)]|uniref:carbohydrate kinase family protein n=1 Tax=unclassified Thermosipho (in: thermotogales) TaxID=2676525 RepID=UPI0009865BB1|nr:MULTISPECIES: carbohydrate kinase family protein [unclassified Thermosipho (in: thermotogales)]MBT1248212.1 ribokinase [Thermosipho sp. 1244]OOC46471.1 ribokinase [Thermosipho sp. 1223]
MFYKEKVDIVCIGKTNLDILYYVDSIKLENNNISNFTVLSTGGKATNVAVNLSKFCLKVRLISCIGNDIFGEFIKNSLENILLFTPKIVNTSTAITSIIIDKDGNNTMFHNLGANKFLSEDQIPEKMELSFIQTGIPENTLIRALKNSKISFVELSETSQFEIIKKFKPEMVSLNLQEIQQISKKQTLKDNIQHLLKYTNNVILKMGKDGVLYANKKQMIQKKAKKVKVVNTTGAGDAVSAAYLYGYIKKWDIEKILDFSISFAAKKIQSHKSTI